MPIHNKVDKKAQVSAKYFQTFRKTDRINLIDAMNIIDKHIAVVDNLIRKGKSIAAIVNAVYKVEAVQKQEQEKYD